MGGNYDRNQSRGFRGGRGRGGGGGRGRGGSGGRGHHHSGGRNHNRSDNRGKPQWQTMERISEPEVGITEFISSFEGFQGIIKSRYSDFVVNELDRDGVEASLKDFALPDPPIDPSVSLNPEEDLKEMLTEEEMEKINEVSEANYHSSVNVRLDVTDYDKEKRAKLHSSLNAVFGKKIFNETVAEEEKKFVVVKKPSRNDQQRSLGWKWPQEYTCFVMYKENIDTLQAIAAMSHQLKTKPSYFGYAGTKDKRGKTSQWISVKKIEPTLICRAAKQCQGIRVGSFKFSPQQLQLGDLKGNRFQIALRSVKGAEKDIIEKSLESLRDFGFINYYGLQRFGNCSKIPTNVIGQALLTSNFEKACELILQEREGEPYFMKDMRKVYAETKDSKKALEGLHSTNTSVEARLLHGLSKHGDKNYLQGLLNIPRNMLMLYTHAYQSYIWNQIASKRKELGGLDVLEGDLVYTDDAQPVEIIDAAEDVETTGETTDNEIAEAEEHETESKFMTMVRPLTKEDIANKKFTIYDIVLPLPGYDIRYPENDMKTIYHELLEKDNLSSEKLKSKHHVFSLTGAYRKVFVKPDNFSWRFMKYEKPTDDLILSDISKIFNDSEPVDNPKGEHLALIIDFILPSSAYATMALREIMKCDTSVGSQMNLEAEVKKETESKNGSTPMETQVVNEANTDADKKRPATPAEIETEVKKTKIE